MAFRWASKVEPPVSGIAGYRYANCAKNKSSLSTEAQDLDLKGSELLLASLGHSFDFAFQAVSFINS